MGERDELVCAASRGVALTLDGEQLEELVLEGNSMETLVWSVLRLCCLLSTQLEVLR